MNKTTLYQRSESTGKGKIWEIHVEDKSIQSEIIIRSGAFDFETQTPGKLTPHITVVSHGKNIGKANETTHYTQAVSEAKSKIDLKIREGYTEDMEKAKNSSSAVLGSGIPKPMLAHKYHPTGKQSSSKTLKQIGILNKKVYVQPKLDGNRCLIVVSTGQAHMYTRKGDLMPVQMNHILNEIVINHAYNQPSSNTMVLDGELFSDELTFNELNGLIKKESANLFEQALREKIKYHLYDVISDEGYEKRLKRIQPFASPHVELIENEEIVATDANIKIALERELARGNEGLMIRQLGIGYENKRTWQLVKVKIFEDAEFELIDFEEDKRGGFVGAYVMALPKQYHFIDREGKLVTTFKAGASGQSEDDRREMLKKPHKYIGSRATIEYFGWDKGKERPRFPKFKGIRD